jgi:hypothetical protein
MNKWLELFLGLILFVGAIVIGWASSAFSWTIFGKDLNFLHAAWLLLKGSAWWIVLILGLLFIILSINDMKE